MNFESKFFAKNRTQLLEKMKTGSVLVLFSNEQFPGNGDQYLSLRQNSDLYYFTGILQEKTCLLLSKDKLGNTQELLFILEPDKKTEVWEGKKLSKQEAENISGVSEVVWTSLFEEALKDFVNQNETLYLLGTEAYNLPYKYHLHQRWKEKLSKEFPNKEIESPRAMINALRLIKSEEEIKMMQKAVDITDLAYRRVLSASAPGMMEYEIEAEISYIFRKNGANGHAYQPIIASGLNACGLHYVKNNAPLGKNDLLLMDFGADLNYYAADLSRTIPVSGKFTERQKQLYSIVLEVQKKSIELYVPGNTINLVNEKTKAWMSEALKREGIKGDLKDLFPHGTSHFLGIDVHDVGAKDTVFEPGMVLTCEPGLYLEEERIGIRIENDIVVGDKPFDLMRNVIREIDEIEEAMKA